MSAPACPPLSPVLHYFTDDAREESWSEYPYITPISHSHSFLASFFKISFIINNCYNCWLTNCPQTWLCSLMCNWNFLNNPLSKARTLRKGAICTVWDGLCAQSSPPPREMLAQWIFLSTTHSETDSTSKVFIAKNWVFYLILNSFGDL